MPRLLLIDDDPLVLNTLQRMLKVVMPHLSVDPVGDPAVALGRLSHEPYDAILSDRHMPGMDGEELLAKSAVMYPRLVRGLLSGDLADRAWHRNDHVLFACLQKPCRPDDLRRGVGTMMEISSAWNDPTVCESVELFHRITHSEGGPAAYDGRTCGRRWFEALGVFSASTTSRSASVLRTLGPDLSPPLALLVGAFDAAANAVPEVSAIWSESLLEAKSAGDESPDERSRITERLVALAGRVGEMAVRVTQSTAPAKLLGAALLFDWGMTAEIVGPLLRGAASPTRQPRLDQSPFAFSHATEARR